jgi:hypothetical protein
MIIVMMTVIDTVNVIDVVIILMVSIIMIRCYTSTMICPGVSGIGRREV